MVGFERDRRRRRGRDPDLLQARLPRRRGDAEPARAVEVREGLSGVDETPEITFDLVYKQDQTFVLFKHAGWAEPVEFMHHCSTKWATFLLSLKQLLETGKGRPAPAEVQVYRGRMMESPPQVPRAAGRTLYEEGPEGLVTAPSEERTPETRSVRAAPGRRRR